MQNITSQRAEKIARNINAMDTYYQYIDEMKRFKFWKNLSYKLRAILKTLTDEDKKVIVELCNKDKAEYFGLI